MRQNGFSLIEVLLSVAMIGAVAAITIPVYRQTVIQNDTQLATEIVVQGLRRAQALSRASLDDREWGVYMTSGEVNIYKGSNYTTDRDAGFEELFEISTAVSFSGLTDISFSKLEGEPSADGSITITSSTGDTRTIVVNEKGMIDY